MKRKPPAVSGRCGVPRVLSGLAGPPPDPRPLGPAEPPRPPVVIPKPASLGDLIVRPRLPEASTPGRASSSGPAAMAVGAVAPPPAARPPGRWDLQALAQPAKASQAAAKATAEDPARLAAWLVKLAEREFAPTSVGPKAAKLRLMEWLVEKGDGGVYPLTPTRVRIGAACLLSGNYRSAPGYLSELK